MAENEAETTKEQETNARTDVKPAKGGLKQALLGVVLLSGLVIGSASAAVVVASIVMQPSASTSVPGHEGAEATSSADTDSAKTGAEAKESTKKEKYEFAMEEPLVVNVYQTKQRRYLSVKPVFVMESKAALGELEEKRVELQHLLIGVLKAKTLEQLDDPEITNALGREIQETANIKLALDPGIASVYFTEFVVQ